MRILKLLFPLVLTVACLPSWATFNPAGLTITGDPSSSDGASWAYNSVDDDVAYDIKGVLFKPAAHVPTDASDKFPAVILNHGQGQTAEEFGKARASVMLQWGLVCIATNLTFAGDNGDPRPRMGAPGEAKLDTNNTNLFEENALRSHKALEILASLGYVDMQRVAMHGHSRGSFVTEVFVARFGSALKVASHTAGGLSTKPGDTYSNAKYAPMIRVPYSMHHGTADKSVGLGRDQDLHQRLTEYGVPNQLIEYPDFSHGKTGKDPSVLEDVHAWYRAHGLFGKPTP